MTDTLYAALGRNIRAAREHTGLSQATLGATIGLANSTMSNIEAGRQQLAVHQLATIARVLGASIESLLANTAPQPAAVARPFWLQRDRDISGVSGIGTVAHGALWPDGTASVRWVGDRPSTVFWDSLDDALAVHGHGGATRLIFADTTEHP